MSWSSRKIEILGAGEELEGLRYYVWLVGDSDDTGVTLQQGDGQVVVLIEEWERFLAEAGAAVERLQQEQEGSGG